MAAPRLTAPLAGSLDDPARARDLTRMKRLATGLFLLAAVVFLGCVLLGEEAGAWVGYVRATAEASMVGALADWFAVTALFRHPLRLPIPHTAIIPRKKDQIGESLGTFVQENFLTRAVVAEKLATIDVPGRLGAFLAAPGRAERLGGDAATALTGLTQLVKDDDLQPAVAALVARKLHDTPAAPALARVLELVVDGDRHQEVLSAAMRLMARFLDENRLVFRAQLGDASPAWVPDWVDDRVFDRAFAGVHRFLAEVAADPRHELRRAYDARLRAYVHALRTDPATAARVEEFKHEVLAHPAVRDWSGSLWTTAKDAVLTAAADPASPLRARVTALILDGARLLRTDPTVRELVQRHSGQVAGYVAERFSGDLADLVSSTVARWDTEETSRRIELQVGRDLQWIRVNGTVVGGLAGLVIYTVAQLLG
ncbi:DUF445 domain-containing protein [Blastococcus sp. MG754426]|uniref:DUF445 domain-containing protein n=1 Tax=unclassified Blastococcus TaxID=2619396 RepID=UPI001EEFAA53|nr:MULTISPECIES: DUF445 domain-containing protein [unclassified Blastococcus]MCF6506198.1 DUF445 domain-containing protein [Blastococcus sp. MG754426]MCF6510424.1 DUF445 domain-containing protein [Blastococcus sp. MG754427]MCF6737645.1 DUF445 domain-containing protein [Blastococcus sp. KM273129]